MFVDPTNDYVSFQNTMLLYFLYNNFCYKMELILYPQIKKLHNQPDPKIPAQHFLNPTRRENCDGNEVCSLLPVGQKYHREEILLLQGDSFIFFSLQKNIMLLKKICPVGIVFIIKENWRGISTLHSLAQF